MIAAIAPRLVALAVAAMAGAVGAWQYQANKYERLLAEQRTEYATAQVRAVEIAHADTIRMQSQAQAAAAAAATRLQRLSADRTRIADELAGLRNASTEALLLSGHSHASCIDRATVLKDVFDQCSGRYGKLAETTDRLASDKQALIDGWPTR